MAMNAMRVGVDIEQASMVGVQVKNGRQGHTLTAVSARALPDGLMFEGEVVDIEGLAAELKTFWKSRRLHGQAILGRRRQPEDRRAHHGVPHHRPQGTARGHRVPGPGGHPDPARRSDPRLPGAVDDARRHRGRGPPAGPHRRRSARHGRSVHAGGQEGRPQHGRHRPSGVRAHALGRASGRLRRPGGAAGGRGQRSHQHRRRDQQPRRRVLGHAGVHARREPRLRDPGAGTDAEPRHSAVRRRIFCV